MSIGANAQVRVLCRSATPSPAERSALRATLTEDELRQQARYLHAIDADRFLVGRGTVRIEVGRQLGIAPRDVPLEFGLHGKPLVRGGRPHINVSHAGEVVLIALCDDAPIGIDVERIDASFIEPGMVDISFSKHDAAAWRALPEESHLAAFFHVWATREAVIKAVGAGFSLPPDAFDVSVDPASPPSVLATRAPLPPDARFELSRVDVPAGHIAMLAIERASNQ